MRSALRLGMTLIVMSLLFLAFNLVWISKLPDIRWDFSQQKVHTLSPPTLQLLATLERPLDLYYFNSLTAPDKSRIMKRFGQRIEDLLQEFETAADGMINLHVIDPIPFSEDAYKASLFGLDDTYGYLGLIGTRAGQGTQRIDAFNPDDEPLLEYQISHLIDKLMRPQRPSIGLLSALPLNESAGQLMEQMRGHFNLVELASDIAQVPPSIDSLMVVQPSALPEQTLYAIEQFVLSGGKLMLFIDPVSEMGAEPISVDSQFNALLATWGIRMPADTLVVDSLYASSASLGPGTPAVVHPARLKLPRQAMTAHDISSWKLDSLSVSSSGALLRTRKSRTTFTPLLQSSRQSALLDAARFAWATQFESLIEEASTAGQRHVIAARIEGPAFSAFPDGVAGQPPGLQKAARIEVVVVADTDLLADAVSRTTANGNLRFVLNTLDNLAAPAELANIRPRITSRPLSALEPMREAAAQAYQERAAELERRLEQTEQAWQRMNPQPSRLGTQAVDTNTQLQALNKERLRLPMELHALKTQAYAPLQRFERNIKLLLIATVPLILCLIAWVRYRCLCRRRWPPAAFS
ncbi:GldG family protein [Pseudomonas sp. MUP55]|uniref:GldG family protein n=1 Tax=Pseudomonas sp. MUP55 TaxID=3087234 RepID=UPI002A5AE25E|nr:MULTISPECIES: Gldg family protein [unclassified Pseudomonas]WPN94358.1 Gldg family protein [Pseudomonas sp. MUP56]WPN99885.1 Gldg family protein [Pseudomonas sp. MUP55]